jgi:hypothetical protein
VKLSSKKLVDFVVWGLPLVTYALGAYCLHQNYLHDRAEFIVNTYRFLGFRWSDNVGGFFATLIGMAWVACVSVYLISKFTSRGIGFDSHNYQTLRYSLVRAFGYFAVVVLASGLYGQKLIEKDFSNPINFIVTAIVALIFSSVVFIIGDAVDALCILFKGSKK